jgi:hypothetical protein
MGTANRTLIGVPSLAESVNASRWYQKSRNRYLVQYLCLVQSRASALRKRTGACESPAVTIIHS